MSKQKRIIDQIKKAKDEVMLVGKLDDTKIEYIEKELNVTLPASYKWYLREYGMGGVSGVKILGGGLAKEPSCVQATKDWREYNLPEKYVVIEDCDEWLYCLDTEKMNNNECPVVEWEQLEGTGNDHFNDFYEYVIDRFNTALDDM